MKTTTLKMLLTSSAISALALTSSCSRSEDHDVPSPKAIEIVDAVELHVESGAHELDTDLRETAQSAAQAKDKLISATRNTLDGLGQKIDELEAILAEEHAEMHAEMHADTREAVARLKEEKVKVSAELDGAVAIGDDKWDAFVNDTRRAMDRLEEGYNQVLENMKTN